MRGKRTKEIRKSVYGDHSLKDRRYARDPKTGEVFCLGLRRKYQDTKKSYYGGK